MSRRPIPGRAGISKGKNVAIVVLLVLAVVVGGAVLVVVESNMGGQTPPIGAGSPELAYLNITSTTPVLGNGSAPVTIYQFGDFQCTFCDAWFKTTEPTVVKDLVDTGQAKLAWKDFDYYGPDSTYASEAAYAAAQQGKFWQFYDELYSNQGQPNSGWASPSNLQAFAQDIGLNVTQFETAFNSGDYTAMIDANYAEGQNLGVVGTPTFFVVGPTGEMIQITGAQPYSVFQSAVQAVAAG